MGSSLPSSHDGQRLPLRRRFSVTRRFFHLPPHINVGVCAHHAAKERGAGGTVGEVLPGLEVLAPAFERLATPYPTEDDVADPTHFWLIAEWADIEVHARIRKVLVEMKPAFIQHIEANLPLVISTLDKINEKIDRARVLISAAFFVFHAGLVKQTHQVGILFNGTGLTQIGQTRLPALVLFQFTVQLTEHDHG